MQAVERISVKVINENDFAITDRYDGIVYTLPAKGETRIPYAAACHIFGVDFAPRETGHIDPDIREKIFQHLQRRWGWNRSKELDKGHEAFARIKFHLVSMQLVEKPEDGGSELGRPRKTAKKGEQENTPEGGRGEVIPPEGGKNHDRNNDRQGRQHPRDNGKNAENPEDKTLLTA